MAVAGTDPAAAPLLLLFDIDGTLLSGATSAHSEALHQALHEVHGINTRGHGTGIDPAGRTDGEIARLLLLDAGVSALAIDEGADDVRAACAEAYARLCPPSLADTVIPGIAELVSWLDGREGVRLSLVTGNYEPVARLKLSRAGIGRHFPSGQGGFGSDSEDRAALPGIARKRAGHDGVSHPRRRAIVIGDTPRDIACAQADDLRCFAVTTGRYGAEQLTGADAVATNAGSLRELLEAALAG
ncbi:MAG TPA: haloacid dehalogenase-like hydrolase [Solirubrobacteraceae bacterium]|nr:haloacid dehalogenase-like hydrolase [Solirubrobacteraceae bacterium]